jgi:hypothetical protein
MISSMPSILEIRNSLGLGSSLIHALPNIDCP